MVLNWEVLMQTFALVVLTVVGVALVFGLPAAFYLSVPASMLERAGRHGRFAVLGTRDGMCQTPSGRAAGSKFKTLLGQSDYAKARCRSRSRAIDEKLRDTL